MNPENTGEKELHIPYISPSPEKTLDLHGYTVLEALDALQRFFQDCREEHISHVRIITGKGTGTLYRAIEKLLEERMNFGQYKKITKKEHYFLVITHTDFPKKHRQSL